MIDLPIVLGSLAIGLTIYAAVYFAGRALVALFGRAP